MPYAVTITGVIVTAYHFEHVSMHVWCPALAGILFWAFLVGFGNLGVQRLHRTSFTCALLCIVRLL